MGEPRGPGIIPNTGWGSSRPTSGKPQRRVRMCKCADEPARSGACPKPPIRHAALLGFEPKPVTSERVFFTVKLRRVCVPLSDLGLSSIDVWSWMMLCRGPGGCCALHCQMLSTSPGFCPPGASNSPVPKLCHPKMSTDIARFPWRGAEPPLRGNPGFSMRSLWAVSPGALLLPAVRKDGAVADSMAYASPPRPSRWAPVAGDPTSSDPPTL